MKMKLKNLIDKDKKKSMKEKKRKENDGKKKENNGKGKERSGKEKTKQKENNMKRRGNVEKKKEKKETLGGENITNCYPNSMIRISLLILKIFSLILQKRNGNNFKKNIIRIKKKGTMIRPRF